MKRRSETSNEIHKMAWVIVHATSYSGFGARLTDVLHAVRQMTRELDSVQKASGIALGRDRSVVIHGITERCIMDGKQREMVVSTM